MAEFTRPLRLTTPHRKGDEVGDAQYLMRGNNRFKHDAHPIKYNIVLDKEYGLESAVTTKRVKYWLGYPIEACNYVFGQTLYEYLRIEKWRPLPEVYRNRRATRIKAAQQTLGFKGVQVAKTYIGTKESPFGTNRQMFGAWYRMNGEPWCDIFVSYCQAKVGSIFRHSYVPETVEAARYGRGLHLVTEPTVGDLVAYTFHGTVDAHIEYFDGWLSKGNSFFGLGGNTGPIDMSNGGEVLRQVRYISSVHKFIRIDK